MLGNTNVPMMIKYTVLLSVADERQYQHGFLRLKDRLLPNVQIYAIDTYQAITT